MTTLRPPRRDRGDLCAPGRPDRRHRPEPGLRPAPKPATSTPKRRAWQLSRRLPQRLPSPLPRRRLPAHPRNASRSRRGGRPRSAGRAARASAPSAAAQGAVGHGPHLRLAPRLVHEDGREGRVLFLLRRRLVPANRLALVQGRGEADLGSRRPSPAFAPPLGPARPPCYALPIARLIFVGIVR